MASFDDASDDGMGGAFAALELVPDALTYTRCTIAQHNDRSWRVACAYSFCGGPEVLMKVTLPPRDAMNDECRRVLAHAGLVLLCWQWMATPCRKIVCKATALTADQRQFWADFYREAFAEFALHNNLAEDACDIEVEAELAEDAEPVAAQHQGDVRVLCGLGGGKDSLVAWLLSTRQPRVASVDWLYVDDGGDEYENSKRLQGVVKKAGGAAYLAKHDFSGLAESTYRTPCGHPWAALCAFDGVGVAALLGYDGFVVGHERSAAEGNGVFFNGREVNHQFDKSLKWEAALRSYLGRLSSVSYVSPLQPLWDLQVAGLFRRMNQIVSRKDLPIDLRTGIFCLEDALRPFYSLFRSCNDSGDCDTWCGACAKCAFVYCALSAFRDDASQIFHGVDLYGEPDMIPFFEELVGSEKAMDCVGTAKETRLALALARRRRKVIGVALAAFTDGNVSHANLLIERGPAASAPTWWDQNVLESLDSVKALAALHAQIEEERSKGTYVNRLCAALPTEPVDPSGWTRRSDGQ